VHIVCPPSQLSNIYINTVVLIVDCLLFRPSLRLQPGRLREGNSSALLEWICSFSLAEWKFWPIICRHFLSVYCYAKLIHLLPRSLSVLCMQLKALDQVFVDSFRICIDGELVTSLVMNGLAFRWLWFVYLIAIPSNTSTTPSMIDNIGIQSLVGGGWRWRVRIWWKFRYYHCFCKSLWISSVSLFIVAATPAAAAAAASREAATEGLRVGREAATEDYGRNTWATGGAWASVSSQ
jgi:hypothetical protein